MDLQAEVTVASISSDQDVEGLKTSFLGAEHDFVKNVAKQMYDLVRLHHMADVIKDEAKSLFIIDVASATIEQMTKSVDDIAMFMTDKLGFYRNAVNLAKKVKNNKDIKASDIKDMCNKVIDYAASQDYDDMNKEYTMYEEYVKVARRVTKNCLNIYNMLNMDNTSDVIKFGNMIKINQKIKNDVALICVLTDSNPHIDSSLKEAANIVNFGANINVSSIERLYLAFEQKVNEQMPQSAYIKPEIAKSPAEQERLNCIKKANEAYNRLTADLLVDVKKQYAASTIKEYHELMAKVDEFEAKHKLPLAETVSLGAAKDALYRINNFAEDIQNSVAELSGKSYQSGGFVC